MCVKAVGRLAGPSFAITKGEDLQSPTSDDVGIRVTKLGCPGDGEVKNQSVTRTRPTPYGCTVDGLEYMAPIITGFRHRRIPSRPATTPCSPGGMSAQSPTTPAPSAPCIRRIAGRPELHEIVRIASCLKGTIHRAPR